MSAVISRDSVELAVANFLKSGGTITQLPERRHYSWSDIADMLERVLDKVEDDDTEDKSEILVAEYY